MNMYQLKLVYNLIAFFVFIQLISSCDRGVATFTIEGQITDLTFDKPLDSATVKLYQVMIGTNTEVLIDSVNLSSNGEYRFSFLRDKVEKYILKVEKDNYFEIVDEIPFSNLNPSEVDVYNYDIKAKSWVEMRFVNSDVATGDLFRFMKTSENSECSECCPGGLIDLVEESYYSTTCINNANALFTVDYWIINGSNSQYGQKQTTPAPFDTTLIEVIY